VAEDQEPGLFAKGRPGRAVQPGEDVAGVRRDPPFAGRAEPTGSLRQC
jgi:hypothetical protein